ncbi:MAG: DnaB-like helicase C-terminal domain-containing protein, partial [Candidatus Hodarchaeales archaeon]
EYENLIKLIKEGVTEPEELTSRIGLGPVQSAIEASKTINGLSMMDWPRILETSYSKYVAGTQLEKISKKLQRGDDVDLSVLNKVSSKAQEGKAGNLVRLSDIKPGKVSFIPSGMPVLDEHVGGWPEVGLCVFGGNPGSGKTWFMVNTASHFAKFHTDKNVFISTIEMMAKEVAMRFEKEKLPKSVRDRIFIDDYPLSPDEIINRAATIENLGMVQIDFADLLVKGETSESSMSYIYRTLMVGAKQLGCTIILYSQLNRYQGGIPKPYHLRWTGLAEALGYMIGMLYNKSTDWHSSDNDNEDDYLPNRENHAFVILWKIRGGFGGGTTDHTNEAPGAIRIQFKGELGWHPNKGDWFSLKRL